MIRVCYVAESGTKIAGSGISLLNLIGEMKKRGVEPYIVCHKHWELIEKAQELGISTEVIKTKTMTASKYYCSKSTYIKLPIKRIFNYIQLRKIRKYLICNNIQVVHINSTLASEMWCIAAKALGIPCIWHIREYLDLDHNHIIFNKKYFYSTIAKADKRIAISKNIKNIWEERIGKSCEVIYNGLVAEELYEECREVNDEILRLLCVGRITSGKGQMDAVKAVEKLVTEGYKNIHLTLVGYRGVDPYELKIKEYIKEKKLGKYITLEKYTYEMRAYRKKSQVGILCSIAEAFGRVTIEYMMAGMIAIGTNSGGTPELIENEISGYLYKSGNYEQLSVIIKNIIENPKAANRIAQKGQERALEKFSIDRTANKIYELYKSIL